MSTSLREPRLRVVSPRQTLRRFWRWAAATESASFTVRPLPWRSVTIQAVAIWLATRIAFAALTYLYPLITGGGSPSTARISLPALARRWMQWDALHYLGIAQSGYISARETPFFPLYPATIRLIEAIIGPHWAAAALIASNGAALLAFVGVGCLAAQVASVGQEASAARLAVVLFAAYPLSLFLFAAYSDGVFAGCAAFTILFAMRLRWGWAALFGLLAALARPVAPALILPLAWEAFRWIRSQYRDVRIRRVSAWAPVVGAVLAPLIGVSLYAAYLWRRFGDPLIFIKAAGNWAHFSLSPLISIPLAIFAFLHTPALTPYQTRVFLDLAPVLCGVVLTVVMARRAPLACTLYMVALLYLITSQPVRLTDVFTSGGRYMLSAVPLFALADGWLHRSQWIAPALCWSGIVAQTMLTVFFLSHGWLV